MESSSHGKLLMQGENFLTLRSAAKRRLEGRSMPMQAHAPL
jgi:hypothetical protein